MNAVITAEVARKITHGRIPLVPVEYETAVKALSECVTFDEAKYWSDKADALAAWSKIYHSDETLIKSKRLKLHAYRRMGELAKELRPMRWKTGPGGSGAHPGPISLLIEKGLTRTHARAASRLSHISEAKFNQFMKNPVAPVTAAASLNKEDPVWKNLQHWAMSLRSWCRQNDPKQCAKTIHGSRIETARQLATDLIDWLEDFERALPKA